MEDKTVDEDDKFFASFGKAPEFFEKLDYLLKLGVDVEPNPQENEKEETLSWALSLILMEYREQSYLLDPFLERIVVPTVELFRNHVMNFVTQQSSGSKPSYSLVRLRRLANILYSFMKFRGRKTIVNFFPHQVADISIALDYLESPDSPALHTAHWKMRYIVLLWLSLVCMIPFDLVKFDVDKKPHTATSLTTAKRLEALALKYLPNAGIEREAAATLLSKLFMRSDTSDLLSNFFHQIPSWLTQNPDHFKGIGLLHVFCEITKSGIPSSISPYLSDIHEVLSRISSDETLLINTVVRKYHIKLAGRLSLGVLPSRARKTAKGRKILGASTSLEISDDIPEDLNIPEEVESTVSILLENLQDKTTSVRYTASKYLARLAERLPTSLSQQLLDSVLELFAIYPSNDNLDDLPAIAEPTWHGACLACAEIARRGLVEGDRVRDLVGWLKKALLFDIRKGAHSVGSSVRDSAAYVVWALARSQSRESLRPYALSLAQQLVCVSLYDREVHVRRAASAAFQENVGRLGLFPHGIDIILKADFFAVGSRRNSFLVVAPQIAVHVEYRAALLEHLAAITLVHWDSAMRQLGAQSLRVVCEKDMGTLAPLAKERLSRLLSSIDTNRIHGALFGLSELAVAYKDRSDENEMLNIFCYLDKIPLELLQKQHNGHLIEASCFFLSNTLTNQSLVSKDGTPRWKKIIDLGLRHRLPEVQEAAASALKTVSSLIDVSDDIKRYVPNVLKHEGSSYSFPTTYIKEFHHGTPQFQQSIGYALGVLSYNRYNNAVFSSMNCLLDTVDSSVRLYKTYPYLRMEDLTRYTVNLVFDKYRDSSELLYLDSQGSSNTEREDPRGLVLLSYKSLVKLKHISLVVFEPQILGRITTLYLKGLEDYSVDERGDVGSWIRIACIRAISQTIEIIFRICPVLEKRGSPDFWLPRNTYQQLIGGILRQGVERLDNVRREAGESFMRILGFPQLSDNSLWALDGFSLFRDLFVTSESSDWSNAQDHFPKAIQILQIPAYHTPVLYGTILSIGSKTDGTQRPMAACLTNFASSLPVSADEGLTLVGLTRNILDVAQSHLSANQIVIPVLQTLCVLLENGVLARLGEDEAGLTIVNWLLTIPTIFPRTIESLLQFLLHPFPKVRTDTAEHLYMVLQANDFGLDTDEIEEIILETDWLTDVQKLKSKADTLITVFKTNYTSK